jgi:hypothetical protein
VFNLPCFHPNDLSIHTSYINPKKFQIQAFFHVVESIKNQNKSILELDVLESQPNVNYFKKHVGLKTCLIIGIDVTNYIQR